MKKNIVFLLALVFTSSYMVGAARKEHPVAPATAATAAVVEEKVCCICYSEIVEDTEGAASLFDRECVLTCSHSNFHPACLQKWFKKRGDAPLECPMCKSEVPAAGAFRAVALDNPDAVNFFGGIDRFKPHLSWEDKDGIAAIHNAAMKGSTNAVAALLKQGISAIVEDEKGKTPLHYAIDSARIQTALLLIRHCREHDLSLDIQTNMGFTPMHKAATGHQNQILRELIFAGANKQLPDYSGRTPLHAAVLAGNQEGVIMLLSSRVNPSPVDETGKTPLHYAALTGASTITQYLVNNGADCHSVDGAGHIAADYATSDEIKNIIAEAMARSKTAR